MCGASPRGARLLVCAFGRAQDAELALFALIVIRNWSLFCLCSVQSLISGGATVEQRRLRSRHRSGISTADSTGALRAGGFFCRFYPVYGNLNAHGKFQSRLRIAAFGCSLQLFPNPPNRNVLCGSCRRPLLLRSTVGFSDIFSNVFFFFHVHVWKFKLPFWKFISNLFSLGCWFLHSSPLDSKHPDMSVVVVSVDHRRGALRLWGWGGSCSE